MKSKFSLRNQKLKTLCTLDTSDNHISHDPNNKLINRKYRQSKQKNKNKRSIISFMTSSNPIIKNNNIKVKSKQKDKKYFIHSLNKLHSLQIDQLHHTVDDYTILKNKTTKSFGLTTNTHNNTISNINIYNLNKKHQNEHNPSFSNKKIKKNRKSNTRQKSRDRIKTQYDKDQNYLLPLQTLQQISIQSKQPKILLHNLQMYTKVKNIKFHIDQEYNLDTYYLVKQIKTKQHEEISIVRSIDQKTRKSIYYLMKTSTNQKILARYQKQIQMKQQLTDKLKGYKQRKNLSTIYKVYKKKRINSENCDIVLVYYMQGQKLSWKNELHLKFIQNLNKNKMQIMKHFFVQISKAIYVLSSHDYYHSQLKFKNILLDVQQDEQNVKVSKNIKLSNLFKCYKINQKKSFEKLQCSIYTPPEILNFIIFQKQQKTYDRQLLNCMYKYHEAWRLNVWNLAILVLQLINQKPLENSFLDISQLLNHQYDIKNKYSYLFDKIQDQIFRNLLNSMLDVNPFKRPSPQQIIIALTS